MFLIQRLWRQSCVTIKNTSFHMFQWRKKKIEYTIEFSECDDFPIGVLLAWKRIQYFDQGTLSAQREVGEDQLFLECRNSGWITYSAFSSHTKSRVVLYHTLLRATAWLEGAAISASLSVTRWIETMVKGCRDDKGCISQQVQTNVTRMRHNFTWQQQYSQNHSVYKLYREIFFKGRKHVHIYWENIIAFFSCIVWDKLDVLRYDKYTCRALAEETGM